MTHYVYILYSKSWKKYYTGQTSLTVEERLVFHLSEHKGFTSKAKDWEIVYTKKVNDNKEALKLEHKIKKRGAKRYLNDLGDRN